MLEEFRVENFLSWIDLSFKPKDINLLIGLNNSGKSNLCNALRFVSHAATRTFNTILKHFYLDPYTITNFSYNKPTVDFSLKVKIPFKGVEETYKYKLSISTPTQFSTTPQIVVEHERLTHITGGSKDRILLDNSGKNVQLLNEPESSFYSFSSPSDSTMLFRVYDDKNNHPRAINFRNFLAFLLYYDLSQIGLRNNKYTTNEIWIHPDGSNLSSVIFNLKKSNERAYRKILKILELIEPEIEVLDFAGGETESYITMYFTYKSGDKMPAWRASNGTLRLLALSYILTVQPSSFLIIEEPENGIYVGYLKKLLALINENNNIQQVLFTSHSPYFIDLFDNKLENVFVTNRDKYRSILSNIDIVKAQQNLKDFSLGEQHFRELLTK